MANKKKLTIRTSNQPAITITANAVVADRLVYIALANKELIYTHGKSRIAYIGTTKTGAHRIAISAAYRATELFKLHGVSKLEFLVVTSEPRQGVKTWHKLEAGLILTFKQMFGEPPKCNKKGIRQKWNDELKYFTRKRLESVINKYS